MLGRQSWQEWGPSHSGKKMETQREVAGLTQGKEDVPGARERGSRSTGFSQTTLREALALPLTVAP